MKKEKIEKIKKDFNEYIGECEVRIYEFANKGNRDNYSVLQFADIILEKFTGYFYGRVRVFIYDDYYVVVGNANSKELRMVGKKICEYFPAGKLCKRYGKSTQLFHCVEKIS